jgi:hypothetical protein
VIGSHFIEHFLLLLEVVISIDLEDTGQIISKNLDFQKEFIPQENYNWIFLASPSQ